MTAPTQEQIEAAVKAFCELGGLTIKFADGSQLEDRIRAALTAAAQVDEMKRGFEVKSTELEVKDCVVVNELDPYTIERCANVAESNAYERHCDDPWRHGFNAAAKDIAAAIRALRGSGP